MELTEAMDDAERDIIPSNARAHSALVRRSSRHIAQVIDALLVNIAAEHAMQFGGRSNANWQQQAGKKQFDCKNHQLPSLVGSRWRRHSSTPSIVSPWGRRRMSSVMDHINSQNGLIRQINWLFFLLLNMRFSLKISQFGIRRNARL